MGKIIDYYQKREERGLENGSMPKRSDLFMFILEMPDLQKWYDTQVLAVDKEAARRIAEIFNAKLKGTLQDSDISHEDIEMALKFTKKDRHTVLAEWFKRIDQKEAK